MVVHYRFAKTEDIHSIVQLCMTAYENYPIITPMLPYFNSKETFNSIFQQVLTEITKKFVDQRTCLVAVDSQTIYAVAMLDQLERTDEPFEMVPSNIAQLFEIDEELVTDYIALLKRLSDPCQLTDEPHWHLELLAVHQQAQGKKIGSHMIKQAIIPFIKQEKGNLLTLVTNTNRNRIFYQKNGFTEFDKRQLHFRDEPIDNWCFGMPIEPH